MTVAEIGCILGTLVGVGVLGTRVEESSGGALAADATLLAPASPAFSIWSVIYGGLAAYTIWQWLPANTANIRGYLVPSGRSNLSLPDNLRPLAPGYHELADDNQLVLVDQRESGRLYLVFMRSQARVFFFSSMEKKKEPSLP